MSHGTEETLTPSQDVPLSSKRCQAALKRFFEVSRGNLLKWLQHELAIIFYVSSTAQTMSFKLSARLSHFVNSTIVRKP